jgi:dethiobiotin synthetase
MESFTQLGIAGAALLVLLLVLRQNDLRNKERDDFFIKAIDRKDAYTQEITNKFSETVNTHLAHENEARAQEMATLTQVTQVLNKHTEVLGTIVEGIGNIHRQTSRIKYGRRKSDKLIK